MELDLLSVAGVAVSALVIWQVKVRLDMHKKDPNSSLPLPPGSFGLPYIGETIQFFRAGFDPMPWHKKYGPICKTSILGKDKVVYLMSPQIINEFYKKHKKPLLRSPNNFGKQLLGGSVIQAHGKDHKYQRTMLHPAFEPRNMRRYVSRTEEIIQYNLRKFEEAGTFDAKNEIKEMAFSVAAEFFLGVKRDMTPLMQELFVEFSAGGFSLIYKDWPFTQFRKTKRAQEQLLAYVEEVIAQRRKDLDQRKAGEDDADADNDKADPLEQMLLQKDEEGNRFPDSKMAMTALVLLFAGFDTTKSSLIAILHKLIEYPEVRKKLRAEVLETIGEGNKPFTLDQINSMEYLDKFLRECFRSTPIFLFPVIRKTQMTVEVGGFQIPKGWYVTAQRYIVSQNEDIFANPEKFDPDREQLDYNMPGTGARVRNVSMYGYGPYRCLGEHFAQLERKIFTVMLLRQYEPILMSKEMPKVDYGKGFMTVEPEFKVRLERLGK